MNNYEINLLKSEFWNRVTDYYMDILKNYHLYTVDKFDDNNKSIFETALILDYNNLIKLNHAYGNKDYFIIWQINDKTLVLLKIDNQVIIYNFMDDIYLSVYLNVYSYLNQIKNSYEFSFSYILKKYFTLDRSTHTTKITLANDFILDVNNEKSILEVYDSKLFLSKYVEKIHVLWWELSKKTIWINIKYQLNDDVYYFDWLLYFNNWRVFSNFETFEIFIKPENIIYIENVTKKVFLIFTKDYLYCFNTKEEICAPIYLPKNYKIYNLLKTRYSFSNSFFWSLKYLKPEKPVFVNPDFHFLFNNVELITTDTNSYMSKFDEYYLKWKNPKSALDIEYYYKIISYNSNFLKKEINHIKDIFWNRFDEKYMKIYFIYSIHGLNKLTSEIYFYFSITLFLILFQLYRYSTKKSVLTWINVLYLFSSFIIFLILSYKLLF